MLALLQNFAESHQITTSHQLNFYFVSTCNNGDDQTEQNTRRSAHLFSRYDLISLSQAMVLVMFAVLLCFLGNDILIANVQIK